MLGIDDLYTKFCIDEAADFVYYALKNNLKPPISGNSLLNKHSKKKPKV